MVHISSMRTDRLILTKKIVSPLYQWSHLSKNTKRFYQPDIWGGMRKRNQQAHSISGEKNNKMKACELKTRKIEGDGRYKLNLKAFCP